MPNISNTEVYGLAQSIFRSSYPMRKEAPSVKEFTMETLEVSNCILTCNFSNPYIKRAIKLANAKGAGHDQFLTGIIVQFDLTVSNKCWTELERYHFLDFVSSMSTMHRISKFKMRDCCNSFVSNEAILSAEKLQEKYDNIPIEDVGKRKKAYLDLLYNIPSGFELMAGMTTNYRCLKNMYGQRRKQSEHRLPDWWYISDWIETLPLASYLITGGAK